jgi:hypothetical protein
MADQSTQEPLSPCPDIVDELKETQVQWQAILRDSSVRPKAGTEQPPEPFQCVDMCLVEFNTIVLPCELACSMAHRLVTVAPFARPAVAVVFIGIDQSAFRDHPVDQGADRRLLDVLQHPDHHLATSLQHPEDRRLLLGHGAPTTFAFQPSPPGEAAFL